MKFKSGRFWIITGLIVLTLVATGFSGLNKFSKRDLPLLIRSYVNFEHSMDGRFAERQILSIGKTRDGLIELIKLTESKDGRVKEGAEEALWDIVGEFLFNELPPVQAEEILESIRYHEDPVVRKFAYSALFDVSIEYFRNEEFGKAFELRADLVDGLEDKSMDVVHATINMLIHSYSGPDEYWEFPTVEVMDLFNNGDDRSRLNAAITLAYIDPENHDPIPILIDRLENSEYLQQWWIINALRNYGEAATDAFPVLLQIIKSNTGYTDESPDYGIPDMAAMSLVWLGSGDGSIIPELQSLLNDENRKVRQLAAEALGFLGPDGVPALPALKEKLDDPDETDEVVLFAVANAIETIYLRSKNAGIELDEIDYLLESLNRDDIYHKALALQGLHHFADDPRAVEALDELRELANPELDENDPIGNMAYEAMTHIEINIGIRNPRNYSIIPNQTGTTTDE